MAKPLTLNVYGVERDAPGEWWDLFCSRECCVAAYGDDAQDAEAFYSPDNFRERLGVDAESERCFHCAGPLRFWRDSDVHGHEAGVFQWCLGCQESQAKDQIYAV